MKFARLFASALLLSVALPSLGQAPPPVRVGELDDRPVVDASGARIAEVYDVVVDTEQGRAAYVVFSVGLKVVPVEMPSPELVFAKDRIELAFGRARLQGMPALDMTALGPRYKRGRDLAGTPLKDPNGAVLGEVKDLMLDRCVRCGAKIHAEQIERPVRQNWLRESVWRQLQRHVDTIHVWAPVKTGTEV